MSKYGLFSGPNTGKYGPAKTHAVLHNYLPLLKACCHTCQYVGSAITFKERFRINKSDINTGKKRCGAAKQFLECFNGDSEFDDRNIQLKELVNAPDKLLEFKIRWREKY